MSDEDEFSVSGDEDHDVVDEDELSSETRRLRAQYGDPRRRGPSTRATKGRSAVAGLADGDDGEDDDDDDESVPKSKGGRRGGARPSRQRKRVVRGEAAEQDELDELLGNEEEVDEEGDKRRSRARKTGGNDSDEVSSEDLDTLPTTKTGALGPDRRVDIILDRRANGTAFEYFVKWQGASYLHCSWVTEAELVEKKGGKNRVHKFNTHYEKFGPPEEDVVHPDFVEVDRILDVQQGADGEEYLVKWQSLGYEHCTWEKASDVNDDDAVTRWKRWSVYPGAAKFQKKERPPASQWKKYEKSPVYEGGNELRDYQLEGLNWLTFNWYQQRNTILADEMGLGKTVQSMSIMHHLATKENIPGPFLVVAPLSTIPHWRREFNNWTTLNAIVYHGNADARELIRRYEFYHRNAQKQVVKTAPKFNVLITTYEMILTDCKVLRSFKWRYVVVDEAHRLKNQDSKLIQELRQFDMDHVLLLTGTPLQNNTTELWSLLNFLNAERFGSLREFLGQYGDMTTSTQVDKLNALLRPIMLRRMKDEVEKSIGAKEEIIVEVELTNLQKRYYRAIYERNFSYLAQQGRGKGSMPSLLNVVMQLRKACNHPFLLAGVEEQIMADEKCTTHEERMQALIKAAGKLVLVDKLLPRLKAEGHKVLIFSQFARVLDILQDYLDYRRYEYERIDGSVRGNDRQAAIDRFSKEGSTKFVFLLCTRAGGVGINLTAADTVIIFDSDWNPQNDVQAQARCHRIGQTEMVKVYRLITRGTYEKDMFIRASKKLGLDQAVLNKIEGNTKEKDFAPTSMKKEEIDSLLRHGAYDVFREGKDKPDVEYDEADIARILERDSTKVTYSGPKQDAFASLSKASFVSNTADNRIDMEDPDFWKKLLPEHARNVVDPNIIEGQRARRSVRKFAAVDFEDDGVDHDFDQGGEGDVSDEERHDFGDAPAADMSQEWSLSSRARFRAALSALGFGRWEEIRVMGSLRTTVDQIQVYAETMVEQLCAVVHDDDVAGRFDIIFNAPGDCYVTLAESTTREVVRRFQDRANREVLERAQAYEGGAVDTPASPAPAPAASAAAAAAPEQGTPSKALSAADTVEAEIKNAMRQVPNYRNHWTLMGEQWESFKARNAGQLLSKLTMLAVVGAHSRKFNNDWRAMPKLGVSDLSAKVPWWTWEHDNMLVVGIYKHGFGKYAEMWTDDALPWGNKADGPLEPAEGADAPVGVGWEELGIGLLNERFRKIVRALLAAMATDDRSKLREKKRTAALLDSSKTTIRKAVQELDWSKRERQDLYRLLTSYGVPASAPILPANVPADDPRRSKLDWTRISAEAALRKAPVMVEAYYRDIIRYCAVVSREPLAAKGVAVPKEFAELQPEKAAELEELRAQLPAEVDLTQKQVQRLVQRLRMFNRLRVHVMPQGREALVRYFDEQKRKAKGLPAWWKLEHDVALIFAVEKHGHFWEDILKDPTLPFLQVWKDMGGSEEEELRQAELKKEQRKAKRVASKDGAAGAASDAAAAPAADPAAEEGVDDAGALGAGADDDVVDDAGAAGGGEDEAGKKKRKAPAGEKAFRRDRGPRCALVGWPKDGILFKRIEQCVEEMGAHELWFEHEGIVGAGVTARKRPVASQKRDTPTPVATKKSSRPSTVKKARSGGAAYEPGDVDGDAGAASLGVGSGGDGGGDGDAGGGADAVEDVEDGFDSDDDEFTHKRRGGAKKRKTAGGTAARTQVPKHAKFDEDGNVLMPLIISGTTTIESLGRVVTDRPAFHSDKYVWPVGYVALRAYPSTVDGTTRVTYRCEIVDGGDKPLFRITADDMPEAIEEVSPTRAWSAVVTRVNAHKARGTKRTSNAVSGPEYFGYAHAYVADLLQKLPGVSELPRFVPQHYNIQARKTPKYQKKEAAPKRRPASSSAAPPQLLDTTVPVVAEALLLPDEPVEPPLLKRARPDEAMEAPAAAEVVPAVDGGHHDAGAQDDVAPASTKRERDEPASAAEPQGNVAVDVLPEPAMKKAHEDAGTLE